MRQVVLWFRCLPPSGGDAERVGHSHQIDHGLRLHLSHDLAAMDLSPSSRSISPEPQSVCCGDRTRREPRLLARAASRNRSARAVSPPCWPPAAGHDRARSPSGRHRAADRRSSLKSESHQNCVRAKIARRKDSTPRSAPKTRFDQSVRQLGSNSAIGAPRCNALVPALLVDTKWPARPIFGLPAWGAADAMGVKESSPAGAAVRQTASPQRVTTMQCSSANHRLT
jgi:hypothetical protein